MLREKVQQKVLSALKQLGIEPAAEELNKLKIDYPEARFGDYSTNAALIMSKEAKMNPKQLAEKLMEAIDKSDFEKVEVAGPGFINFWVKVEVLMDRSDRNDKSDRSDRSGKILLEYFQPNIAKPLHVGHLRTAIIGDAIKRMLKYVHTDVESDTHMGDWGTQFGNVIAKYKYELKRDPHFARIMISDIHATTKAYIEFQNLAEDDPIIKEQGKIEFKKLEDGDPENRKIWKQYVDLSIPEFLKFAEEFDLLPFDHHWPESFYEDKMSKVVSELKNQGLLKRSEGAWIVDLTKQNLGVAIIIKSDGGTTYLLRDLATFIFGKQQGFMEHLYVVDNRQSLHYNQLFAVLKLLGEFKEGEGVHIDYGFMSFKGEVLSTRKGNIVLAEDLIAQAQEKASKIIEEKNPDLKNKDEVVKYVAIAALKFFDLSHNRHSDIEFDWKTALDFEGKSGPYIQYTHARLASILRKTSSPSPGASRHPLPQGEGSLSSSLLPTGEGGRRPDEGLNETERRILFLLSIFNEKVTDSLQDYLPNIFADYLYDLANHLNRFYHESPVLQETDQDKKTFRQQLVSASKEVLAKGLDLLGIRALDEM